MRQTLTQTLHARALRRDMAAPDRSLWEALRNRRFKGLKFRRQVPLGPYIFAFYCAELRLVVDLVPAPDAEPERGAWLSREGFSVFRATRQEVACNPAALLARIAAFTG